jgi:hypothetical protein
VISVWAMLPVEAEAQVAEVELARPGHVQDPEQRDGLPHAERVRRRDLGDVAVDRAAAPAHALHLRVGAGRRPAHAQDRTMIHTTGYGAGDGRSAAGTARAAARCEARTITKQAAPARSLQAPGKISRNDPANRSARSQSRVGPRR